MTTDDVRDYLSKIRDRAGRCDKTYAHIFEDEMAFAVLRAIAEKDCDDPVALAKLALESRKISFMRWYS